MSTAIATISFTDPCAPKHFTQSLQNTGFAVITNCPFDSELLTTVYEKWALFFDSKEKHQYPYNPLAADGFASTALSETSKGFQEKDLKEFFHFMRGGRCPEHLKPDTLALFDSLLPISQTLLGWIQLSLPVEIKQQLECPLENMAEDSPNSKLRLIHYPPLPNAPTSAAVRAAVRAAEHEDINLITLLPAATAKGLQAKMSGGQWVDVACPEGALIVNAGDMLAECTQNFIKSTTHRVINPVDEMAKNSRMSMPLFVHPKDNVRLSVKYTARDYRLTRYRENGFKIPKDQDS